MLIIHNSENSWLNIWYELNCTNVKTKLDTITFVKKIKFPYHYKHNDVSRLYDNRNFTNNRKQLPLYQYLFIFRYKPLNLGHLNRMLPQFSTLWNVLAWQHKSRNNMKKNWKDNEPVARKTIMKYTTKKVIYIWIQRAILYPFLTKSIFARRNFSDYTGKLLRLIIFLIL